VSDIPTVEPQSIVRGDTVTWKRSLSEYPAPTWVLRYEFRGPASFAIIASADGTDHLVAVAKASTANWNEGLYAWQSIVDNGVTRKTIWTGRLEILKDLAQPQAVFDPRTHAEIMIDHLQTELQRTETLMHEAHSIGARQVQRRRLTELRQLLLSYRADRARELRKDRVARGLPAGGRIKVTL
jgi:hypothetical protein